MSNPASADAPISGYPVPLQSLGCVVVAGPAEAYQADPGADTVWRLTDGGDVLRLSITGVEIADGRQRRLTPTAAIPEGAEAPTPEAPGRSTAAGLRIRVATGDPPILE